MNRSALSIGRLAIAAGVAAVAVLTMQPQPIGQPFMVYTRNISTRGIALVEEPQAYPNGVISISFDDTDTPDRLARYDATMKADPAIWRTAVVSDAVARQALLDAFGIVVIPAPMGQFEHNAAYHVGGTAWWIRHDKLDGLVGVGGFRMAHGQGAHAGRQ